MVIVLLKYGENKEKRAKYCILGGCKPYKIEVLAKYCRSGVF
jgi:hypothetical protein